MPRRPAAIKQADDAVSGDTPLRLDLAARLAFPDGSMKAAGLRREAARGRLVIERVAGKDYTTLDAIRDMRKRCQLSARPRDCGSGPPAVIATAGSSGNQAGSSSTAAGITPQDALRAKLSAPSSRLPTTSPANTARHARNAH